MPGQHHAANWMASLDTSPPPRLGISTINNLFYHRNQRHGPTCGDGSKAEESFQIINLSTIAQPDPNTHTLDIRYISLKRLRLYLLSSHPIHSGQPIHPTQDPSRDPSPNSVPKSPSRSTPPPPRPLQPKHPPPPPSHPHKTLKANLSFPPPLPPPLFAPIKHPPHSRLPRPTQVPQSPFRRFFRREEENYE